MRKKKTKQKKGRRRGGGREEQEKNKSKQINKQNYNKTKKKRSKQDETPKCIKNQGVVGPLLLARDLPQSMVYIPSDSPLGKMP